MRGSVGNYDVFETAYKTVGRRSGPNVNDREHTFNMGQLGKVFLKIVSVLKSLQISYKIIKKIWQ